MLALPLSKPGLQPLLPHSTPVRRHACPISPPCLLLTSPPRPLPCHAPLCHALCPAVHRSTTLLCLRHHRCASAPPRPRSHPPLHHSVCSSSWPSRRAPSRARRRHILQLRCPCCISRQHRASPSPAIPGCFVSLPVSSSSVPKVFVELPILPSHWLSPPVVDPLQQVILAC